MEKSTTERQLANIEILDLLKKQVIDNPDMRFGQMLYSTGILTSHFSELAGKSITDDIFYMESSEILNNLKNREKIGAKDVNLESKNMRAQLFNPIKVISITDKTNNVDIEPYVKMVIFTVNATDIKDSDNLDSLIKMLSWKGIFVAGITIGDIANKELPASIPWFHVKSSEDADIIINGINHIVGIKGIIDLEVYDVIDTLKESQSPYYTEAISKNGSLSEVVRDIINNVNKNWHVWFDNDNLLISIVYNRVHGKEGLSMKEMESITGLVCFCCERASYRWGLAVDPSLPEGAVRVTLLAS